MNCKIMERVLKDIKVINGEKRERSIMKEEKIKNKRKEETTDRELGELMKRRNIG